MSGYFNLELNRDMMPTALRHELNHRYKGAVRHEVHAPDAVGTLIVWARSEQEKQEHLVNALFDLIFKSAAYGVRAHNPPCPFCGAHTQRRSRNSAGKRTWMCQGAECGRYFVLDRAWRGGLNHPSASKKPEFVRLLLAGVTPQDAAEQLGINRQTANNWSLHVAANNPQAMAKLNCPCGKPMRHRGTCAYRLKKAPGNRARNFIKQAGAA